LWTSVLDKDGKLLKKVSVKPLSKLTKQHLKNIFADYLTGKQVLPKHYKETIEWMIEKDYL
jgi:5'(3')-deoxyribonucleotidase